jgi:hypothetical protein
MNSSSEKNIRFLQQAEIDLQKWDQCISRSANGLIYAYSFYLNRMAKNWGALVLNDYEAVMPLPWNRKYVIRYLYQPPFTAQLGIFSTSAINQSLVNAFILQCKKLFLFCEIHLNHNNPGHTLAERANYILNLQPQYEEIRKGYKKNLLQNIKKAEAGQLHYASMADYEQVIRLNREQYGKRFPHVTKNDYQRFSILCAEMLQKEMLLLRNVHDESGELLSAAIFFKDDRRIYNIMPVTLARGREKNANALLLDQLIREFSGQNIILDFEGSEIPGVAEFYRKFGSVPEPYPFLRFNHLPFPFRYFKGR